MTSHQPPDSGPSLDLQIQYQTLSIHIEEKSSKAIPDKDDAIRQIDVHTIPVDMVYQRFSTSPTLGLESPAVARLAQTCGKNIISPPKTQYWKKFLNYIFGGFNFLTWIAFIVTALSYKPLGEPDPQPFNLGVAVLLLLVIAVSATPYAVVDFYASRIMKSSRNLIAQEATVIRNGECQTISSVDIVVGDIVLLTLGDRVPADIRIVKASSDLRFDRSLLTGESDIITPGTVLCTSDNAMETRNLALNSTFVVQGKCKGVVFATGDRTIMGRIVAMSGETEFRLTTVQKEVWFFTKIISALALVFFCISIIVWAVWLRSSFPGFETATGAIIKSIGSLIAFLPLGLPVCVALSLTVAARRLAARHVLVKNLATFETLGCMSVLCSDKTGTLTEGNMSVQRIVVSDTEYSLDADDGSEKYFVPELSISLRTSSPLSQLALTSRLCNGAKFEGNTNAPIPQRTIKGDPTDTAVIRFAEKSLHKCLSLDDTADVLPLLSDEYKKIFEIPFNSRNKWMMSIVQDYSKPESTRSWMLIKGAPDVLFPSVTSILDSDGKSVPFDSAHQRRLSRLQRKWSSEGQRVIAVCKRSVDALKLPKDETELERMLYNKMKDLTLVGLICIRDPPRADVKDAVRVIRAAGIRIFMVTGDFMITALAIAKQVGIISQDRYDTIHNLSRSDPESGNGPNGDSIHSLSRSDSGNEPNDDSIRSLSWSDSGDESNQPSEKPNLEEMSFSASVHEAAKMKPTDNDPIKAIVLTGDDVDRLTVDKWNTILTEYTEIVFARTTPKQKMLIVEETKKRGDNVVAVTGDGVNDAPALKASDIGIAIGSGSDVAKEAGEYSRTGKEKIASYLRSVARTSIILYNNDFSSIPVAIESGRLVFENLRKVILYLMPAGTYTGFIAVFAAVILGMQVALSAYLQVCFSMTNDVVMSISLMYEKAEFDLMTHKPRNVRTERLSNWRFFVQFIGLMMWPCAMSMWFLYMSEQGLRFYDVILVYNQWQAGFRGFTNDQLNNFVNTGQCVYYVSMIVMQYGGLLSVRNRRVSVINSNPLSGPRRNLAIPVAMVASALIGVANLYGPHLRRVFGTAPIPSKFWGIPFGFALGILIMDETRKLIVRSYPKSIIAKMAW